MTERHILRLTPYNRDKALQGLRAAKDGWVLELREPTRTDEQNDALHGLIDQILRQRPHMHGMKMSKATYKAIFMQALGTEMTMLPTLEGDGFFPLGLSTSKLSVRAFSDLMELIFAWCAREGLTIEHFEEKAA